MAWSKLLTRFWFINKICPDFIFAQSVGDLMKFSSQLEFNCVQEWADKYINYEKLKEMIYDMEKKQAIHFRQHAKPDEEIGLLGHPEDEASVLKQEKEFSDTLLLELQNINTFYTQKENELKDEEEKIRNQLNSSDIDSLSFEDRRKLREQAKEIYINLCSLKDFVVLNYTGFSKILKSTIK
jgi:SPX domain protein involved in polyphosphate accumulation